MVAVLALLVALSGCEAEYDTGSGNTESYEFPADETVPTDEGDLDGDGIPDDGLAGPDEDGGYYKSPDGPPAPESTPPDEPQDDACEPSYPDECLDPTAEDYDCEGGSGDGPEYVDGPIRVEEPDPFDLDRNDDGVGCES